jgi:hypothetical protein
MIQSLNAKNEPSLQSYRRRSLPNLLHFALLAEPGDVAMLCFL